MIRIIFVLFIFLGAKNIIFAQINRVDNTILFVDNEPFLPFGIYTEGFYDSQDYLDMIDSIITTDMNTVWIESNAVDSITYENFHINCDANDIKIVAGLPLHSQFPTDFEDMATFQSNYTNIFAWDILDDSNNFLVEDLINQKNEIHHIDTSRILSQSMYALGIVEEFNEHTQFSAMQGYPWGNGNDDLSDTYNTYSNFCDTVKMNGHFPIVNNQVFNWPGESYPSEMHLDCQSYLSLICGAKGIINYTYLDYDQSLPISTTQTGLWNQLKLNATEFTNQQLKNHVLFGNYHRYVINEYTSYATWELNDKILFIIVNASSTDNEQINVDLSQFNVTSGTDLFSDRSNYLSFNSQSKSLEGNLPPYGISILLLDNLMSSAFEVDEYFISIFPNPTQNTLIIQGLTFLNNITIFNNDGQVIERLESSEHIILDISGYTNGTYYLRIENKQNQSIHVTKILKQ